MTRRFVASATTVAAITGHLAQLVTASVDINTEFSSNNFGNGLSASQDDQHGPWGTSVTDFEHAFAASVDGVIATSWAGPDLSQPYALPFDNSSMWMVGMDVKQGIRLDNSTLKDEIGGKVTTGSHVVVQAPEANRDDGTDGSGGVINVDPSWGVCVMSWTLDPEAARRLADDPDPNPEANVGTCDGKLGDTCMADLEKNATRIPFDGGCRCPDALAIPSCRNTTYFDGDFTCTASCKYYCSPIANIEGQQFLEDRVKG